MSLPPEPKTPLRESLSGPHALLLAGVLLVALNFRGPLIAVSPVIGSIRSELGIGGGTAGLLTTLPVLCFGLAAPLAFAVIAKVGAHRAVLTSLAGILLATVLRSVGGVSIALVATVVLGIAITIGNVVLPVVIGRDFSFATALVTGAYTATMNVGAMLTAALTAPIADLVGWRLALMSWGILTLVAAAVWMRANSTDRTEAIAHRREGVAPSGGERRAPWRRPRVWALTLALGCQGFSYFGLTAWLPTLLSDENGLSARGAGVSSSIFQILAVVGAFMVPLLTSRGLGSRSVLLIVCTFWVAMPIGLLVAPGWWPLWAVCGGIAQGGGITVIFIAVVTLAVDVTDNRAVSAFVQGGGYVIGATGPFLLGASHDLTDGWSVPLIFALAALLGMAALGSIATGGGSAAKSAPPTGQAPGSSER